MLPPSHCYRPLRLVEKRSRPSKGGTSRPGRASLKVRKRRGVGDIMSTRRRSVDTPRHAARTKRGRLSPLVAGHSGGHRRPPRRWPAECSEARRQRRGHAMTPRTLILALVLAVLAGSLAIAVRGDTPYDHLDLVDAAGHIRKPSDYRDRYQSLGVYTVLDPNGNEMHYTYASPGT